MLVMNFTGKGVTLFLIAPESTMMCCSPLGGTASITWAFSLFGTKILCNGIKLADVLHALLPLSFKDGGGKNYDRFCFRCPGEFLW